MPNNVRQEQEVQKVTWEVLHEGAMKITDWIEETIGDKVSVYGIPRGGMIPAIMIVHQLEARGIKARFTADLNHLMPSELHKLVVIDEICDSGDTFRVVQTLFPFANTATVFRRSDATFKPSYVAYSVAPGKWLEFPWEIN